MDAQTIARFWSKVEQKGPQTCWLWTAVIRRDGYGGFHCFGRFCGAHRVSWCIAYGEIPANLCVLHRCDVKECVNPAHLWLGTKKENTQDMMAKGRHRFGRSIGEKGGTAKLTELEVREIRRASQHDAVRGTDLAIKFAVSTSTISYILRRESWKHVDDEVGV